MRIFVYLLALMTGFSAAQAAPRDAAASARETLNAAVAAAELSVGEADNAAIAGFFRAGTPPLADFTRQLNRGYLAVNSFLVTTHRSDRARE